MFDLIIKNGMICDGSGAPAFRGDIGIAGDRIAYVGEIEESEAASCVIDARGKTVTPGFIDPHTHVDLSVLECPDLEPYLKQGVTTVVTGNCGYGLAPQNDEVFYGSIMDLEFQKLAGADEDDIFPLIFKREKAAAALKERYGIDLDWKSFDDFSRKCDALPLGANLAPLIGYSALRTAVMGEDCMRPAAEEELEKLEELTRESMEAGAFGLSTGRDPIYVPGPYADNEEMHRMLKVVAEFGGIFTSHTFNTDKEGRPDRMGGYREMMEQAKGLRLKVNISHVHVMNMAKDGEEAVMAAKETLKYFDQLCKDGYDLSFDVIPSAACSDYTQGSFGFYLKPLVLMSGSRARLGENFRKPEFREMVRQMVKEGSLNYLNPDMESSWLGDFCILRHRNPDLIGKDFFTCAEETGVDPLDAMMDIFAEDPDMIADMVMPNFENAVDLLCMDERAMPCSDGSSYGRNFNILGTPEIPVYPNSMNIGCIPRYLSRCGRENFEHAVHQATSYAAKRFGIEGRGEIRTGNFADLVIIDRERLHSYDEDDNVLQDPEGIDYVLVNGRIACCRKNLTADRAGRVLRRKQNQEE